MHTARKFSDGNDDGCKDAIIKYSHAENASVREKRCGTTIKHELSPSRHFSQSGQLVEVRDKRGMVERKHPLGELPTDVLVWLTECLLPDPRDAAVLRSASKMMCTVVDATGRNLKHERDLQILCAWRESCPELRDMWREGNHGNWEGVTWSDGRVTGLELRGKGLGGSLPHLEGLTSLQEVWLGDNDLSGPIPENLFEGLTSLQVVSLYNNELSESIPEKLFEGLTSLQEVHLTGNQLSGSIPQKLFEGLTSLQVVSLFHNRLLGSIPEKLFEGLTSLQVVGLLGNKLSGSIPEKLFEGLTSLQTVTLSDNKLSGSIPEKLFEGLTSLGWVDLGRNKFSGSIPEKLFERLTSLEMVGLANNQLSGSIPKKLFEGLTSLQAGIFGEPVRLDNNQLSGSIPERLREIVKL